MAREPWSLYESFKDGLQGGRASRLFNGGRFEDAAAAIYDRDPEKAARYLNYGDRQTELREKETEKRYRIDLGKAFAAQDYDTASTLTAGRGDLDGVLTVAKARTQQQLAAEDLRVRKLMGEINALGAVAKAKDPRAAYANYWNMQGGGDQPAPQWSPDLYGAKRAELQAALLARLDPEKAYAAQFPGAEYKDGRIIQRQPDGTLQLSSVEPSLTQQGEWKNDLAIAALRQNGQAAPQVWTTLSTQETAGRYPQGVVVQRDNRGAEVVRSNGAVNQQIADATKKAAAILNLKNSIDGVLNKMPANLSMGQMLGIEESDLDATFADLQIAWKEAAELGAIQGPDQMYIQRALGDPTGLQNLWKGGAPGIRQRLGAAAEVANRRLQDLKMQYPDAVAARPAAFGESTPSDGFEDLNSNEIEPIVEWKRGPDGKIRRAER